MTTAFFVFAAASPAKPKATRSATGSSALLLISSAASAFTSTSGLLSSAAISPPGKAHVAAHAQHRIGAAPAQVLQAVPERLEQAQAAGERVQHALAAQAARR